MIKKLRKNQEGSVAVLVGILLPVLAGFLGMALDVAHLVVVRTQMQNAVDAAVCAGGLQLPNSASATTQANSLITSNGFTSANATFTFTQDAVRNPSNAPEINGTLTHSAPTYFMSVFRISSVNLTAYAEGILISGNVGGVFNYAVFSNQEIVLSGTNYIKGNLHTNNDLIFSGTNTITGRAECLTAIGSGGENIGTLVQNTTNMSMPDLTSQIEAIAAKTYTTSKTFSGTTTLTGDIYVKGSVTISGTVNGTGSILATGGITMSGALNISGSNQVCLYSATGNITTSGTISDGTGSLILYAPKGGVTYSGTATIDGGIIANQITGSGTLTVNGGYPVNSLPGGSNHVQLID
jgi:cytoskeletal protein CcmA (bactofilin family)